VAVGVQSQFSGLEPRRDQLLEPMLEPEAAWIDLGVDDLTKFRIVEYLYQRLGSSAEVVSLASALGFRSAEHTTTALNELAERGVILLEVSPEALASGVVRCAASADPLLRSRVAGLIALSQVPEAASDLLQNLSRRTLARIRARRRGRPEPEADDRDEVDGFPPTSSWPRGSVTSSEAGYSTRRRYQA